MKKNFLAAAGLAVLTAGVTAAFAFTAPGGGVLGSKHDINAYGAATTGVTKDAQDRVCAFCHTPHHALDPSQEAAGAADYLPLWSHDLTNKQYLQYWSPTLDAQITDPLLGPSRLCMSCHDGQIAIDTHYGTTGTKVLTGDSYGQVAVGEANSNSGGSGDLRNDHPIGFNYTEVINAKKGINPASTTFKDNTKNIAISEVLHDGAFMTCASCHDVHNKDNVSHNTATYNYFVYSPQKDSALCLTCHDK